MKLHLVNLLTSFPISIKDSFSILMFSSKKDVKVILITQRRVGYYLRDHIIKCFCAMPYTYIVYLNEIDINPGRYSGQYSNLMLIKENSQKMSYFCHWIVYANWTWCNIPFLHEAHNRILSFWVRKLFLKLL